jgi:hypothetical protein
VFSTSERTEAVVVEQTFRQAGYHSRIIPSRLRLSVSGAEVLYRVNVPSDHIRAAGELLATFSARMADDDSPQAAFKISIAHQVNKAKT